MSSSTSKTIIDRQQLGRQTGRILNTNSLHFITIALLFIPFNFSVFAAVQFYFSFPSGYVANFDPFNLLLIKTIMASSQNLLTVKTLTTVLAVAFFVIVPAIAGIALITYSTYQAIYRRPLTFSSTFKSLSHSYIPLLFTVIAGSVKLIFIFLLFTLSPIAVNEAIKALGFHFDLTLFLIFTNTLFSYLLALAIFFFIVIWGSAAAIAVLESKSGFQALRQSANQSSEFRSVSFSILYLTCFVMGSSMAYIAVAPSIETKRNWISILLVGVVNLLSSLMILYYAVANTVLYVQCKVARGEAIATMTIEGEVSGEYVKVAVNEEDDDASDELAKEEATGGFSYVLYFLCVVLVILVLPKTIHNVNKMLY